MTQGNPIGGFSLVELIVVVTIMAILLGIAFSYTGWQGRYRAEKEIREMYVDLLNARARAMQRNRLHFVVIDMNTDPAADEDKDSSKWRYAVWEDTAGTDDTLDTSADTKVLRKTTRYPIEPEAAVRLAFNRDGLLVEADDPYTGTFITAPIVLSLRHSPIVTPLQNIYLRPDYDCLELSITRTNLGEKQKDANGIDVEGIDGKICISK